MNFLNELYRTWQMAWNTKQSRILKIEKNNAAAEVFDIEMPRHHNFFANNVLAHNCHQVDDEKDDGQYMQIINTFMQRNPKTKIVGYTGSPWRGTEPIKGTFWKQELYKIDMWSLVEMGFVHKPVFGFGDGEAQYNLNDITQISEDGTKDYTKTQLAEMQKRILESGTTTQKIMLEVIELTKNRNGVLITCAGSKHIKECSEVLQEGTFATITERATYKERKIIKDGCNAGRIKYVLQIGCWTVGVNIPPIDTIVILRKIGSLTLLTQLIGRGIRLLKPEHEALGMLKKDCLVLDYAGTMESIGHLFNDPIVEAAELTRAQKNNTLIDCPRCNTMNSAAARRCIGKDHTGIEKDARCGFFWSSKKCESCGTENDQVARSCRECDAQLIDPNANLTGKHYIDANLKNVLNFSIGLTKNTEGLVVTYQLENDEIAREIFYPQSTNQIARRIFYSDFICVHSHKSWHNKFKGKTAAQLVGMKAIFDAPKKITHRLNDKGRSIIHRKEFNSGRVENKA